jgi:hypothetical protein
MTSPKTTIFPFSHHFLIRPVAGLDPNASYFLNAMQQVVDSIVPESLWIELKSLPYFDDLFAQILSQLPIFQCSKIEDSSTSLSITYLCLAKHGQSAKRYVAEALSRWLIPGKTVEFTASFSFAFQFIQDPSVPFFIAQETIAIRNQKEGLAIQETLPDLLADLKRKLPRESTKTSNVVHTIFMPRNEEELIRNLIILAAQIKYVKDLPQVSIHYEKQTEDDLTFTIIAARLLKGKIDPMKKVLEKSRLKIEVDHIRTMGCLLQKYPKEAAIFHLTVSKAPFFRPDYSVDLLRARQKIVSELNYILGEFRDFNGGMILKQDEALNSLRQEIGDLSEENEFLLENYFYSLKPGIMQTILDSSILKAHFELLLSALKSTSKNTSYRLITQKMEKFFLYFFLFEEKKMVPAKESLVKTTTSLQISPHDLTHCLLEAGSATALGFILKTESAEAAQKFQQAISALI